MKRRTHMTGPIEGLGLGIYTPQEVGRLAKMRTERVLRWIRGYEFKGRHGKAGRSGPIFATDWQPVDGKVVLSFLDLVELLFVKTFLDQGVSMFTIRRAAQEGARLFQTKHPFCVKKFETDGRDILVRLVDELENGDELPGRARPSGAKAGRTVWERLLDLVRKQAVFKEVFNPLLKH